LNVPDPERWARLSPLLDELLDLPPPERAARLAAITLDEPDLGDELAALLAGSQQAQSARFLTGVLDAPTAAAPEHSLAGQDRQSVV
jgi:serine/threonine-protein kinase